MEKQPGETGERKKKKKKKRSPKCCIVNRSLGERGIRLLLFCSSTPRLQPIALLLLPSAGSTTTKIDDEGK
jgi:hypothetical protein